MTFDRKDHYHNFFVRPDVHSLGKLLRLSSGVAVTSGLPSMGPLLRDELSSAAQ